MLSLPDDPAQPESKKIARQADKKYLDIIPPFTTCVTPQNDTTSARLRARTSFPTDGQ
ncbi:MAG: hypothetical protein IJS50_06070 [Desulfovibrio sp.]|nr:hypothetical protein [Desulfovibrio sp.]